MPDPSDHASERDVDDTPSADPFAEAPASPDPIVEWQPTRRRLPVGAARSNGAVALGAIALGVFAIGALAVGTLAIGQLAVGRARVRTLRVDRLVIGRLERD